MDQEAQIAVAREQGYAHRLAIAKRFAQRLQQGQAVFATGHAAKLSAPHTISAEQVKRIGGFNSWMLMQVMQDKGWSDARFFTQPQVERAGWKLSEQAQPIVLQYMQSTDAQGMMLQVPKIQRFAVYNSAHIEGVPPAQREPKIGLEALRRAMVNDDFMPSEYTVVDAAQWALMQYSTQASLGATTDAAHQALVQALTLNAMATHIDVTPDDFAQQQWQGIANHWTRQAWVEKIHARMEADPNSFFDAVKDSELLTAQLLQLVRIAQQELNAQQSIDKAHTIDAPTPPPTLKQEPQTQTHPQEPTMQAVVAQVTTAPSNSMPQQSAQRFSFISHDQRVKDSFANREAVLAVPFAEKDEAQKLGAVWFKEQRVWFVPKGLDVQLFKKWNPTEHCLGPTASTEVVLDEFAKELDLMGLIVDDIKADGQWHNVRVNSKAGKNKAGAYLLDLGGGKDGTPRGFINNKHTGEERAWSYNGPLLTPEQRAAMRAQALKRAQEADLAREAAQEKAAEHAVQILAQGRPAGSHGYVLKKGINPGSLLQVSGEVLLQYDEFRGETGQTAIRADQDYLVIPMVNAKGQVRAVQAINEEGSVKSFMRGAQKKGTMSVFGANSLQALCERIQQKPNERQIVSFVEGYATGSTLWSATKEPVVVCWDAGNLESVIEQVAKDLPPNLVPVLAIDNDLPPNLVPVLAIDNDQFFVERALGLMNKELGVNPHSGRGQEVQIASGKQSVRGINLGDVMADGKWHQAKHGRYSVELVQSANNSEILHSLKVHFCKPGMQRNQTMTFGNRGLQAGLHAQALLNERGSGHAKAVIVAPEFARNDRRHSDWNDLAAVHGMASVQLQFTGQLASMGIHRAAPAAQQQQRSDERQVQRLATTSMER